MSKTIFERVRAIDLDATDYVVIGSGVMDAVGLRQSRDVDLAVSRNAFETLKKRPGWKLSLKYDNKPCIEYGDFEVWLDWGPDVPSFEEMHAQAIVLDGIHFANFETVMRFKQANPSAKNSQDIRLIEQYLAGK